MKKPMVYEEQTDGLSLTIPHTIPHYSIYLFNNKLTSKSEG